MKPSNDRETVTLILEGLAEKGVTPYAVNDGEDFIPTATVSDAVEAVMAVDMATVYVNMPPDDECGTSFLWFVLGNDPVEVVADCGVNLGPFIDPIIDPWIDPWW